MHLHFTIYAALQLLGGVISAAVAAAAWRRRAAPAGRPLCALMLAAASWAFVLALEAAAVEPPAKIAFSKLEYVAVNCMGVFLWRFALVFTGRERWLTPRRWAWLWALPIVNMGMAATNEWHHLIWPGFAPGPAGSNLMVYLHGPWYWVNVASSYLYNLASSILLLRQTSQRGALARGQAASVVAAVAIPWLASVAYVLDLSPVLGLQPAPIAFALSGVAFWVAMNQYRLLDLLPVARSVLIETMPDGVLVFDAQGRLLDTNPAAREALRLGLGKTISPLIGQAANDLLSAWPQWAAAYTARANANVEISMGSGDSERIYHAQISPLFTRSVFSGYLTLLRDTTANARAERALRESERRFRRMSEHLPFPLVVSRVRDRKLLYCNPQAAELFGEPAADLIARDAQVYYEDPSERAAIWEELGRAGMVRNREVRLRRADGTVIWVLFSLVTTEMDGERVALLAMADIAARKEIEAEREALIAQLQEALASIKTLSGLVPICASCKKIRDDTGYWHAVEQYVSAHSQAEFTHGICPDCMKKLYGDFLETEELRAPGQTSPLLRPASRERLD